MDTNMEASKVLAGSTLSGDHPALAALGMVQKDFAAMMAVAERNEPLAVSRRRSPDWQRMVGALSRAQRHYRPLVKTRTATESMGDRGSRSVRKWLYADLSDLLAAALDALNAEGIFFTQGVVHTPDMGWVMVTELLHDSGAWMAGYLPIADLRKLGDPTEIAAVLTLARRYCAAPLLGIAAEEAVTEGISREAPAGAAPQAEAAAPKPETAPGAAKPAPPARRQRAEPAAAAGAPPAPSPTEPQAEAPAVDAAPADYTLADARNAAQRDLRNRWLWLTTGRTPSTPVDLNAARGSWGEAEPMLRHCRPGELEVLVDQYRGKFGEDPPALDGLIYPAPLPAQGQD